MFALLGTTRKRARGEGMAATQAYARVDYGLTRWLVDAAAACGSRPRFVYLSAIGVRPDARNPTSPRARRARRPLRNGGALDLSIARPAFHLPAPIDESLAPAERAAAAAVIEQRRARGRGPARRRPWC
ncbi:MAG: hypothetical protein U0168_06200 [Nannocystaceae bacterium]